ncbi:hypothetical protein EV363DRAFT_1302491 [Boletus edulis]|nr:hypothetical protein EV363DRAFT_1302491 [Boletus edulis]
MRTCQGFGSMLEIVRCNEEVEKQLSDCEHRTKTPCSQDLEDYRCAARCAELMACCGKSCNATCNACQSINDTLTAGGATKRTKHVVHACQKCEHLCQGAMLGGTRALDTLHSEV